MSGELDLFQEHLVRPDLSNVTAERASVVNVEIDDGRLTGLAAPEGLFRSVVFRRCRMDLSSFAFARLDRVTFEECRLEQAEFREARLTGVAFERCDLTGADFTNARCERTRMRRCTLEGLQGVAGLRGVAMTWEDVVEGAGLWAAALGIGLLDEDDAP